MWTRQGGWSKDRFQPQEAEVWDVGGIGQYPEQWRLTLGTPVAGASFGPQLLLLFWCARNRACCHCFCCQSAVPTSYTEGLWLFLRLEYSSESFFSGDGVHDVFYPKIGCTVSLLHTNVQVVNFSKMQTCVPSVSDVRETAACCWSSIADGPSALPSLTSPPSSRQELFLPVHATPASPCIPAVVLYYCTFQD